MDLRETLKQRRNNKEENIELTFEQYMSGAHHTDTELLALESKVSDFFNLKIIDRIKSLLPFGKKVKLKSDTLATFDIIINDIDKVAIPTIRTYKNNKEVLKEVEKLKEWGVLKDSYHLGTNKLEEVLTKTENYLLDVLKNKTEIIKLIETNLTDNIDNKSLNAKQLAIVTYVETINNAVTFIMDLLVMLMDLTVSVSKNRETYIVNDKMVDKLYEASTDFKDKILKSSVEDTLKEIKDIKDVKIFDAIDNGASINELCGPNINKFIGNPIYHFRKFIVDIQLRISEKLKEKKNFLECILIEKQAELAKDPENIKLQKQVAYYADQISKIEAKIEKLEKI